MADSDSDALPGREEAIIWTQGLTHRFGAESALAGVDLAVPRGKIFGFIGPSGAGKTTAIRVLTGVYDPTAGDVRVLDKQPTDFDRATQARIGYMPQLFVLYPTLSVWGNLNFVASLYGMGLRRRDRLQRVLEFVELYEDRDKLARDISGGMQRRLSLAATLVHDPELIFLDEPTAGVDPVLRRKFWDHFRTLQQQGRTLFITTQYVSEAAYCDLVGVLSGGRLLFVDTPQGLRYRAFGGDIVTVEAAAPLAPHHVSALSALPFVRGPVQRTSENTLRLTVNEAATDIAALLDWSEQEGVDVETVEEYLPPFDDVFVQLVQETATDD